MYLAHYGLNEPPFSITPDPRFVFLSERHRDALAHLLFGVDQGGGGGFVQLTGEVGTGKTTLCRVLLEQLPDNARVALVLNPQLSPIELLETICEELGIAPQAPLPEGHASLKSRLDLLNAYLLEAYAQGLSVVLIIDEAQNLSVEALEQVRLLTNLETPTQKLLQIILLGQPELRTILARDDLRQLAQRVTARFHLTPLGAAETDAYLRHRWRVAGGQRFGFTPAAVKRVHRHSGGVPRLINIIAERSLLAGYAHDETQVGHRWVERAAREALAPARRRWPLIPTIALTALVVAGIAMLAAGAMLWSGAGSDPAAPASSSASTAPARAAAATLASGAPRAASAPAPAPLPVPLIDDQALIRRILANPSSKLPAWQQLLSLWRLPSDASSARASLGCAAPATARVRCLRGQANLDQLARQGRPALLELRTADGTDAWAVLLGVDALNVRLHLGKHTLDTERITLEQRWTGRYAALWRAPRALGAGPLVTPDTGARAPIVDWVRARLQPRYLPASDRAGPFDTAMRNALRRYQRAHGLAVDGVIGPETLMAMSPNDAGPHLLRVLE